MSRLQGNQSGRVPSYTGAALQITVVPSCANSALTLPPKIPPAQAAKLRNTASTKFSSAIHGGGNIDIISQLYCCIQCDQLLASYYTVICCYAAHCG